MPRFRCSSDSAASGCAKRCPRTAPLPRSRRLPLRSWSSFAARATPGTEPAGARAGKASAPSCFGEKRDS